MAEQPKENRDQETDTHQGKGDGKKGVQQQGSSNPEQRRSGQQNPLNTERRGNQNEESTEAEDEGLDRGERTRQQYRPNH